MNPIIEKTLLSSPNVYEFLQSFFKLSIEDQISFFPEKTTIRKGTYLYRVRKADKLNDSNCNNLNEWGLAPRDIKVPQGRFNYNGNRMLYVASSPDFLEEEVGLKVGEEYYLAKYECINTFKVGNIFTLNSTVNSLLYVVALTLVMQSAEYPIQADTHENLFASICEANEKHFAKSLKYIN